MATCKGMKLDGTPCQSPIVMSNGYCARHQDQARQEPAPAPAPGPQQAITCQSRGDLWCLLICVAGALALILFVASMLQRLWRALQD